MSKIIHCCWFGGNPKSKLIEKCITSWKRTIPQFEVREWNEETFDVRTNQYVYEAFQMKKWAFVSDFVRLWALYNHGGIYLDTDVEVFRDLSPFLHHDVFTGFELYNGELNPVTAIMGSKKGNPWIRDLLDDYRDARFVNKDGSLNLETNTRRITRQLLELGVDKYRDTYQVVGNGIHIYPSHYFCCSHPEGYAIHHFDGSWVPRKQKIKKRIVSILKGRTCS